MGKVMERDTTGRTVQLTNVRLSFADSLKDASLSKKADPGSRPTHGTNFIIEKGTPDYDSNVAAIKSALRAAAKEYKKPEDWWETLWADKPDKLCFRKGDRFKTDDGVIYKGYEGHAVVVAKGPSGGQKRPKMLDRHKREVEYKDIHDVMYGGSYCDAQISFYGTDTGGTARLTCSVEAIRSRQEGERLGGGGIGVDVNDFEDLGGDDSFDQPVKKTVSLDI